ncbi:MULTISPECIES: 1-deoxy-D-xylulose-5-phosphate reductoisomerase [Sphingomonas]|uniref:1-deoxy-D-xylulose-5-phosphate reductoisomerase n=1 Tax=Sphingomonas TaxID=13687 RepID=UPI0006F5FCE1|nr:MULTISPECIES: 1-deoxy-D-xylulose-5-phosphate reductoisomerase [Sphingomonas]KQM99957.1 1-deoxy-D-xylulose 5-phosphate reductoisomerase [Sphingomonas sp. Leaf226]MDY0969343.1 1-deoxy-D-xylulose-5-phosphate reductoisomerase [Sphingomonas sp. CFBP9021]USQ99259.1 1-deoxy-D-xylulose-5-phosphate reductoisomerase [Sphingomonas aerolata]
MKSVTILGATGSVGTSTLDLVEREPDRFRVVALTANCDVARLAAAAIRTRAEFAVVADEQCLPELQAALAGTGVRAGGGADAIAEAAASGADWTMGAIVGCAGLKPVLSAIEQGGTVVIANKEPLVSAGDVILRAAARSGATLLPADSEHNAIFQCFDAARPEGVRRIILTCSGGPFRDWTTDQMRGVTLEQAVKHPNWSMGAKISVDSATMMNKGLELIEAARLFPIAPDRIEIVIHAQSVIHSLVDYVDGSVLAQLGPPDMRTPIAHTLAWPDRMATPMAPLDLVGIGRLDFAAPDPVRFPALRLAREALDAGGGRPAILNAANEVAVDAFLNRRIGFLEIAAIVEDTLIRYDPAAPDSVDAVLAIDAEARRLASERVKDCVV